MCDTSMSGAVHSFNSLNFFPVAKLQSGVVEGGSISQSWKAEARTLPQVPEDSQSQTGPRYVILETLLKLR